MERIASHIGTATSYTTGLSSVASITFLAWDYIISIQDEVHLIWQRPNGWFRWLYVFIRYIPPLAEIVLAVLPRVGQLLDLGPRICEITLLFEGMLLESVVLGVEIVLVVRVHILYGRNRSLLTALVVLLIATIAGTFVAQYFASDHIRYDELCLVKSGSWIMVVAWLSVTTFETLLFAMTILKFGQSRLEGLGKRPILDTIVWDGTWAYVISIVVMVLNALLYTRFTHGLSGIIYRWSLSVLSFLGSHVLLNLRMLGQERTEAWENQSALPNLEDIPSLNLPSTVESNVAV